MKSGGGVRECVCLRETSIKQHLSAFSFRWLSSSIHIVIAVMSAWSTTKSAGERMVRYSAISSAKSDMVLVLVCYNCYKWMCTVSVIV